MKRFLLFRPLAASLAGALVFSGCGNGPASDIPPVSPVHGVVKLDGQPLAGATVFFMPETGPSSGGLTNADGVYEARFAPDRPGVPKGPAKVVITTSTVDAQGLEIPEKVPAKYNQNSMLQIDVVDGDNEQNFELTTK